MSNQKKLILIDGHALAYRMFFALERTGMKTSQKEPTWAVYGFVKAIVDILRKIKPDGIIVSFDMSRKTFRTEEFEDYKAQRAAMPDDLRSQMSAIMEGVQAFDIPIFMMENFEADDIIGTIATKAKALGHKSYILTGDQDSFQLIDKEGCIRVLIPHKNELIEYDCEKVFEKLGVYPEQIIDYKALRGDVSDNIPGVKGIGEKTAAKLLSEYKTLDNIYENIENISSKSIKEKLTNDKEMAYKSQFLASIKRDVDIDFDFDKAKLNIPDVSILRDFLTKYEFHSLLRSLTSIVELFNGKDLAVIKEELPAVIEPAIQNETQLNLFGTFEQANEITVEPEIQHNFSKNLIDTKEKLENLLSEINSQKLIGIIFAINGTEIMNAKICGVGFAYGEGLEVQNGRLNLTSENKEVKTAYIPTNHPEQNFFNTEELINLLKPILENQNISKITHNAKFILHLLKNHNVDLKGIIFDTMLADYIQDSSLKHGLKQQALSYLKFDMQDATELLGKGKTAKTICELPVDKVFEYFSNDVFAIFELAKYHTKTFDKKNANLFYEIELPLTFVLFDMERSGVSIDKTYLTNFSQSLTSKIENLENEIFDIAQESFNLNSPKQVGEILFEKLGLKSKGKNKTKTGYSTSAEVLEELAQEYEIAKLILENRHLNKIKSTYIDALPDLISPVDNRIHTTFNQTITTTGRLSSSNPNLQNIPARTEIGNEIRAAFIPKDENSVILAADYSQIELRLLAHYSEDEILTKAFRNNEDIHTATAANIFGVPINEVTSDMRRKAKTVNFGIIYGQTRYGLAESLGITPQEAQIFIDKYFETYPKIQEYMERTKFFAIKNGYVETLYGRKRFFGNELNSSNRNIREFAQRAAINAPLQGTAADLIKLAMINLYKGLKDNYKNAKMIIQVHDELVIEMPEHLVEEVARLTIKSMELSQPLNVPLVVDLNFGKNWKIAKIGSMLINEE